MTNNLIRPARPSDAKALTTLAMLSKQSNGYDDTFMAACAEELRVTPDLLTAKAYWVAETNVICGFVCLNVDAGRSVGAVDALFVHPDHKGHGIGRLLWQTVVDAAQEQGLRTLLLDADPAAEGFYCRMGLSTVGRVPSGSIAGRTLPRMRFALTH